MCVYVPYVCNRKKSAAFGRNTDIPPCDNAAVATRDWNSPPCLRVGLVVSVQSVANRRIIDLGVHREPQGKLPNVFPQPLALIVSRPMSAHTGRGIRVLCSV